MGGYSLAHAMMMLIPEAWEKHTTMDRQPARLLRISRGDDGALGRPRGGGLHRRPPDRRHAGPQRPATGALHRHRRRPGDHGFRSRRAADPRGKNRQEVAPAAGQDVPHRRRAGAHHRRQGAEGHSGRGEALPRVDRAHPHQARRRGKRQAAARALGGAAARPPAGLRLHAGRPQVPDAADGRSRRRGHRLDGQRFAPGGAVEQEQDAVPLLQAAVRAGHQPADRPDPRGPGDVAW